MNDPREIHDAKIGEALNAIRSWTRIEDNQQNLKLLATDYKEQCAEVERLTRQRDELTNDYHRIKELLLHACECISGERPDDLGVAQLKILHRYEEARKECQEADEYGIFLLTQTFKTVEGLRMQATERDAIIAALLTDVAQVFDGWHADGTAWSDHDQSVRQRVSEVRKRLEEGKQ